MRINSSPVASATPNDVAKQAAKDHRRKQKRRRVAKEKAIEAKAKNTNFITQTRAPDAVEATEPPSKNKRRRKRRKKRGRNQQGGQSDVDAPIDFFSSSPQPAKPAGTGKKKRRRRRRGRGGSTGAKPNEPGNAT
jgi:hypothetical protein